MSSRRELYKLRELVHFLLSGKTCCFCKKPLSPTADLFTTHGNATGPIFEGSITIHHVDGNHDNNEAENKALCHAPCHKSHHRSIANNERALRSALKKQEANEV